MSLSVAAEILEAAEHLPEGATLAMSQVGWDDYERLLDDLAGRSRLRVTYDCGSLHIVSQTTEHGWYERLLEDLIRAACQIVGVRLEKCGGATWKRPSLSKGVEADASYYIENAGRIIGKRRIDLESDPPPDVVVEVEVTTNSDYKLPVYAALKVPEVWRYDGQSFRFYRLEKGKYVQAPASRFLQGLAGQMLADALEAGKTIGQDAALNAFRRKFRSSQAGRKHR